MNGRRLGDGATVAVSAIAVLFAEDLRRGLPPLFSSSSGTAVRDSIETATEHAVLERVERDAVAIWWYNRLVAPRLPGAEAARLLPPELGRYIAERGRVTWHLVLDTDLPAPVVVAVSCRADGSRPAMGAAAALSLADAVRSATLEMLQVEIALSQMRAAAAVPGAELPPILAWSEATDALRTPYLTGTADRPVAEPAPIAFADLAAALDRAGIEVLVVDVTRHRGPRCRRHAAGDRAPRGARRLTAASRLASPVRPRPALRCSRGARPSRQADAGERSQYSFRPLNRSCSSAASDDTTRGEAAFGKPVRVRR